MIDLFNAVFQSFWTFAGTAALLMIVASALVSALVGLAAIAGGDDADHR